MAFPSRPLVAPTGIGAGGVWAMATGRAISWVVEWREVERPSGEVSRVAVDVFWQSQSQVQYRSGGWVEPFAYAGASAEADLQE